MSFLLSRKSTVPQWLIEPAPTDEALDYMLRAAVTAPDHGCLRPWRFHIVRGEGKTKMAKLFAKAAKIRNPEATEEDIEKERERPLRAPLLIVVSAHKSVEKPGIPMSERVLSAGAASQNILLAAHEKGYGAMWVTGWAAYDPTVKAGLGLKEDDRIVSFIYVGTADRKLKERNRPDPEDFTCHWTGDRSE